MRVSRETAGRRVFGAVSHTAVLIGIALSTVFFAQSPSQGTAATRLCSPGAPRSGAVPSRTTELIVVKAKGLTATTGSLSLWRRGTGCFVEVAGPWPAWAGRSGFSSNRREGDGTTPLGTFRIGPVVYGVEPDPGTRFSYHRLVCGDWWDEDSSSPDYNRFVHVPCGAHPDFSGDSEALWTEVPVYRYFAVIDFNTDPVVPGRGSGIFLHVASGAPTNGCVAIGESELVRVLRWLSPRDHPLVTISA